MLYFLIACVVIYVICDINYFVRSYFTVISGRFFEERIPLTGVTTIYGICTFQDCDIRFKSLRLARLVREIDFSRYHFYARTGIYTRSRGFNIKSLQGCTLTLLSEPVPLFKAYKINTKLIYWDNGSLFFEHEVMTVSDKRVRYLIVSRQHAIGGSIADLLIGLPGADQKPMCPDYIKHWLESMTVSSTKIRATSLNK